MTRMPRARVAQCPTDGRHRFHYHGFDPRRPVNIWSRFAPCPHRHTTVTAALACTARNEQEVR